MWKIIIFAILLLISIILIFLLLVYGSILLIKAIRHKEHKNIFVRAIKIGVSSFVSIVLCISFVLITQFTASTPSIRDEYGKKIESGIAELISVDLNGRKEWISIRGYSIDNPVLLFLAGGPGGTQMAAVRHELSELEKSFTVVNWDQPGSGKSYKAISRKNLTPQIYIEDGYALTQYLLNRFNKEKLYLLGESWGSALGIFLASKYPDSYHAFIGTGQMVAFLETEIIDYNLAIKLAKENGDTKTVTKLEKNGSPPYYGKDITSKSAAYLNYLSSQMARNSEIHNSGYNTIRDLTSDEYGIWDSINFIRGIINTFNHVYPQLYSVDLRIDYAKLEIPTYFFLGRYDINAPLSLAEDYYQLLSAPHKEIVWFEHSGHSPWINERDKFVQEIIKLM